jgi:hypothetical protein
MSIFQIHDETKLAYLINENYVSSCVVRPQNAEFNEKFGLIALNALAREGIAQRTSVLQNLLREIWNPEDI